jgi:hypothetical protein
MNLTNLKKEYGTQDNRATAYPIYVQVQEQVCIGVIANGYSPICPFGDGVIKYEHDCDGCDLYPCVEDNEETPYHCANDVRCGYIWHPVEFFLTIKGAEEYMKANAHNHGKLRTYVSCFERRNYEMRGLLKDIGFEERNNE